MPALQDFLNPPGQHRKLIIITGPYHAGKSRFIQTITGQPPISVDVSSTIGENIPNVELGVLGFEDGQELILTAWPGPSPYSRLGGLWSHALIGVLLIFDIGRPDTFREVLAIRESLRAIPLVPVQFVANDTDPAETWTHPALQIALRITDPDYLTLCKATVLESVGRVLLSMTENLPPTAYARGLGKLLWATQPGLRGR